MLCFNSEMFRTYMSFEVGFRKQTLSNLTEASLHHRKKHARHCNMVSRLALSRHLTATVNRERARDVPDRHLVAVLLNANLLKLDEF